MLLRCLKVSVFGILGFCSLWMALVTFTPVFFYTVLGSAKRYPDFYYINIRILYDCHDKHVSPRNQYMPGICILPDAQLIFLDFWGNEVYRAVTDTQGVFWRGESTVVDDKLGKAKSILLISPLCQSKKYPISIERRLTRVGEWKIGAINYDYKAVETITCDLVH